MGKARAARLARARWTPRAAVTTVRARRDPNLAPRDRKDPRKKERKLRPRRRRKQPRNRKAKLSRRSAPPSPSRPTARPRLAPGVFQPSTNANQPSPRKENLQRRKRMSAISRFVEFRRKAKGKNDLTNLNRKRNDECFETRGRYGIAIAPTGSYFHPC